MVAARAPLDAIRRNNHVQERCTAFFCRVAGHTDGEDDHIGDAARNAEAEECSTLALDEGYFFFGSGALGIRILNTLMGLADAPLYRRAAYDDDHHQAGDVGPGLHIDLY